MNSVSEGTVARPKLWLGAFVGFYRPNAEQVRSLDPVSKFLYSARSVILVISAQAAIIAGLLAAAQGRFRWLEFVLVLVGFVVAHMISNAQPAVRLDVHRGPRSRRVVARRTPMTMGESA